MGKKHASQYANFGSLLISVSFCCIKTKIRHLVLYITKRQEGGLYHFRLLSHRLEFSVARCTRERDDVTDVSHTGNEQQQAFESQSES